MEFTLEVLADDDAVAQRAASYVAAHARVAVAQRGTFTLAVSGGRTPWRMFDHLAEEQMPWAATRIFQVDERIAPAGDPDRNLTHLRAALAGTAADVVAMPVPADDLDQAAAHYASVLPVTFDLVHLGLGPDGHTASLVPGDDVLAVRDAAVAVTAGPYLGRRRMTLTYSGLARAARFLWLVTGAEKSDALARLLAGDRSIPAGCVSGGPSLVLADREAVG